MGRGGVHRVVVFVAEERWADLVTTALFLLLGIRRPDHTDPIYWRCLMVESACYSSEDDA